MKIGKDEIGLIGIIGLLLIPIGAFLTVYEFLSVGGVVLLFILGIVFLVVGFILYYMDLFDYRKKRRMATM